MCPEEANTQKKPLATADLVRESAFYKGESQEKKHLRGLEGAKTFARRLLKQARGARGQTAKGTAPNEKLLNNWAEFFNCRVIRQIVGEARESMLVRNQFKSVLFHLFKSQGKNSWSRFSRRHILPCGALTWVKA